MAASQFVVDVNERDFESAVLQRSKKTPVVVDFWATWCRPCLMLSPLLEKLADEYAGKFILAKIDVDQNQQLAAEFRIESIPTVYGFAGGRPVNYFMGVLPEGQIRQFLNALTPSEIDAQLVEAAEKEAAEPAAAQALYEKVLAADPQNSLALGALADILWSAGQIDRAKELARQVGEGTPGWPRASNVLARAEFHDAAAEAGALDQAEAKAKQNPKDMRARLQFGFAQAAAGRLEDALATLLSIVEEDRAFGYEHARPAMIKIFNILGPQHETSNEYRSRLSRALY